jgi:hypothetical protein
MAFRWFFAVAGVAAFYVELLFFTARPVIIGATLTMMGYPLAAWLDGLRRGSKDDEADR